MPDTSSLGYDSTFLGTNSKLKVPLPQVANIGVHVSIDYHHFTTCFNKQRNFALYCACNIPTKTERIKVDRPSNSNFKEEIEELQIENQIGEDFYKCNENDHPTIRNKNLLDRGHVIRREYPQWETKEIAEIAAKETFLFANIAPQHHLLNQGDWKDLEDHVIKKMKNKVSVFTGCIFTEGDPVAVYTGDETDKTQSFRVPTKFWKVVYYLKDANLHRIAFVLSQEVSLQNLDFIFFPNNRVRSKSFVKDPFSDLDEDLKPFIVEVDAIEVATGLVFTSAMERIEQKFKKKVFLMTGENQSNFEKYSKEELDKFL
ncbi:DNA/RNA non-specific endonuclease [Flagellimonas sp. 389]|uniref:DNA/RNA non-specific endonuclease n=1 Tax=Flagellimonas sp. 389 TaxID=2835862 RepID=UPI001BD34D73|nr:DNA/RNA non-specific endonuclease [Flagellimonas sp. 389]MBS9462876.1 DNA/RNA non-specific endonuclease [Flagellimonas sp. 389]